MEPQPPRPSEAALNSLLMIAGYLRDLGVNNSDPLLPPDIQLTGEQLPGLAMISNSVRKIKKSINAEAQKNDEMRLTGQWGAAKRTVEDMSEVADQDPSIKQILSEKRTWDFNEILPGGKKVLTLDGMLEQLKEEAFSGLTVGSCMNYLGGQVADWLSELAKRPRPPK